MTTYSKLNIIYRLQKWLDSVPGQTFMNYAYSWGASIVILGTLFKLTHLPGANLMLFIGMGTEVFVFFIAAFDRPFDKTADGMDLPTHVEKEGVEAGVAGVTGGGTVIIGGGAVGGGAVGGGDDIAANLSANGVAGGVVGGGIIGGVVQQPEVPEIDAEEMEEATAGYVEQLKKLTETLQKVSDQSERLTRDSEEMENLNRTLTGICKVYEMQLKGASQQIGTIDQINEQSKRMAEQIAELNKIYTRMIEAMTVNMPKVVKSEE
ncbi:gliding motility protein GldL [Prevotella sp. E15-22]|uniref:type IX secretion system motor protein PorL/GldL n=1 Tax=Prevotella sp. E15-22 TaxID=2937774 RepID=UPI00206092F6|nr:gliding motility protein GldL [Prevotella sp. E15-22]UPS44025.1 gliding motility protein GldL [Prevotella sp. E15-22]